MKVYLDCLSCMLRQALGASRIATEDETLQKNIMTEAIGILTRYESFGNTPEAVGEIHRIVKKMTGVEDPYHRIKKGDIRRALRIMPDVKRFVNGQEDSWYWALKTAAVGNVLDSAITTQVDIEKNLEEEMKKPFKICDVQIFKQQLKNARNILVIGDNAGETVFDTVLLEQLFLQHLYYGVRGEAVINDATVEDAKASKIDQYAQIISSGCDTPGLILEKCSNDFLDIFYKADIVISKGQGNYETLSDCDRDIFFLLKAKCPLISNLLEVKINEYIFKYRPYPKN